MRARRVLVCSVCAVPCIVWRGHLMSRQRARTTSLPPNPPMQVAMHGAALTFPMYMPSHGGVIEFWPKAHDIWRCFEHIAIMSGKLYERWANPDPARFRADDRGDYTNIHPKAFEDMFVRVLAGVEERRVELPVRGQQPLGA